MNMMSTSPAPAPYRPPAEPLPGPVRVPEPPQPGRPRRWGWLALIGAAAVGIALWLALRTDSATKTGGGELVQPAPVPGQTLATRLRVAGQTSARNFAQIMVPTFRGPDSGTNLTLMSAPKPGAFVKTGDVVAEFDPQSLLDHIDDVKDQVESAENDVKRREAQQLVEWTSLQQNIKVAKADWDKALLDLKASEVKTVIEREIAQLSADEAEAAYKQIQKEAADRKAAHAADLKILQITVQRQKIHLNNHVYDVEKFKIRTPMAGLVVMAQTFRGGETRQVQVGDQVHPGMQIMKVVDLSSMQLEARVSQTDSSHFRVGQTAEIGIDAFPGLKFPGRIRSIGAIATKGMWDQYYIRNVPVNIAIEGSDARLIPDLSAWAFVNTDTQQASTR
jgi:membrane fusion protein (multidrug efflux system)